MARQSRWQQFGDAFNAVYNAGTTLGQAIDVGGIAFKDYEDEEGNKLTGLALDRARMRQANRIFESSDRTLTKADLTTIQAEDIRGSRLFAQK